MIGNRLRGTSAPSMIAATGSELHLKFVSWPLFEDYRDDEELDRAFNIIGGFRGFRIKIKAEKGNTRQTFSIFIDKSCYIPVQY